MKSFNFDRDWLARSVAGRVSVIVVTYNIERYLREAIESGLAQDGDVEIILADDGSTDGTRAIIAEYAATYENVVPLYSASNVGPFTVRNQAMLLSSGEFIAFLDGDDLWSPGKIEAQRRALVEQPDAGLSHHFLMRVDEEGRPHRRLQLHSERYDRECFLPMIANNGVATTSVMVRRAVIAETGGFDERFRYRGDWEMWTRIARSFPFAFVAQELGSYRLHADNVSRKVDKIRPYAFAVLDKFEREFGLTAAQIREFIEPQRANMHRDYGLMSLVGRDLPAARRDLWTAMRRSPEVGTALALAKSVIYEARRAPAGALRAAA